ncbi:succinate--hydroxymethylglutarate CoA-transferase-like [Ylistrum balloti]|uniref:succinate--hydroxymethylglutarate CoA-transferase-like n=1 Tax=Ylistrum balloti TaxID=509963 RepID=UPI002905E3C5|nr:succinate--hydroxymethylglutarate CoA-transferase-like [Ylistrum balloti]
MLTELNRLSRICISNIFAKRRLQFFSTTQDLDEKQNLAGGPLDGIQVLDLTRVLAGPYCTMILADLGANVIKVEKPGVGDDTRTWGPPFCGSESAYFLSVNRNKKSIAIDLKKKDGQEIVKELVRQCDVLVENYIPGKLDNMGLGYSQLAASHPDLIYCSISGYGQTGPYQQRAGYDIIAAGLGGLLHITGPRDGEPCKVGVAMTDLSTGLYAHGAIMAALLQRLRTGKGQHIDCDLVSTQVASLVNLGSNYLNAGQEAQRYGTAHQSIVPYQAFQTANSYIMVGGCNNQQFTALCQMMELDHLSSDVKFINNQSRVENREELLEILSDRFLSKTTDEWLAVFEGSGLPYGPINNMEKVFSDPQVLHNNMVQELQHPTVGQIQLPGPAVRYSQYRRPQATAPPTLGQHTDSILKSMLGFDQVTLQKLRESCVIE